MKLAIFGTAGFAREVADIGFDLGYDEILLISKGKVTDSVRQDELPIVSEQKLESLVAAGFQFVIGVGQTRLRQQIRDRYAGLPYVNLIHPQATFGYGQLAAFGQKTGNLVFPGARMTNHIEIGSFGIYYLNCTVAHDCVIEDFVTLCPGATISGNVKLSQGAFIGANACVLQGKSLQEKMLIGRYAMVGASALVTNHVPDHKMVKGVPAK